MKKEPGMYLKMFIIIFSMTLIFGCATGPNKNFFLGENNVFTRERETGKQCEIFLKNSSKKNKRFYIDNNHVSNVPADQYVLIYIKTNSLHSYAFEEDFIVLPHRWEMKMICDQGRDISYELSHKCQNCGRYGERFYLGMTGARLEGLNWNKVEPNRKNYIIKTGKRVFFVR